MNMPTFSAEASLYKTRTHYRLATGWTNGSNTHVDLSQLGVSTPLRTPIVCNGNCPPPICHFHCGPCKPDSTVPSGCARTCCTSGSGCEDPGCSSIECPASACCPVTCDSSQCSGGSCGTYPTCMRTPGTMPCTDCHGNPATSQPC
jgi:hypothetical protein